MIDPNPQPLLPAIWASHVGRVAAAMPAKSPTVTQQDLPPHIRLAAMLGQFRRRAERIDHARRKLTAEDLLRDWVRASSGKFCYSNCHPCFDRLVTRSGRAYSSPGSNA
jgi:hypothetical protein